LTVQGSLYLAVVLCLYLNKFLANQGKRAGEKVYLNSKVLYGPLKNINFVVLFDRISDQTAIKSIELPHKPQSILEKI
jgi:hypothetical protein